MVQVRSRLMSLQGGTAAVILRENSKVKKLANMCFGAAILHPFMADLSPRTFVADALATRKSRHRL